MSFTRIVEANVLQIESLPDQFSGRIIRGKAGGGDGGDGEGDKNQRRKPGDAALW